MIDRGNKGEKKKRPSLYIYMKSAGLSWWKRNWIFPASFLFTVFVLALLYISRSIYPFGDRAYLRMDFYHQYAPFVREFFDRVHNGQSLLFSWQNGMGLNFLAIYAYYLASPFNWLLLLWPRAGILEALNFYIVIKGGLASLCLTYVLSQKFRTKSVFLPAFGCIYGLSAYYLAYSCNIIWMDVYFLAPLVLWGVERIVKGKGMEFYLISMTLAAFSNFYLAFILGICCVLYFVVCLVNERRQTFLKVVKAIGRFLPATLIAVMTAAVVLLPAALALKNTPSGGTDFPAKWESYFSFWELLLRFAMNAESIQKGSDLPNIYCSVFCIFLLPLFFCNRRIRLRKKISYGLLCAFLLVSFEWNILDYIWHGLHFPNSFPARQSFFLIFLLIVMGFETFHKRAGIPKVFLVIFSFLEMGGLLAGFFLVEKARNKETFAVYLCTIFWIGLYGIFLLIEKNLFKRVFPILICVVLCSELMINTLITGMKSTVSRNSYLKMDAVTKELIADLDAISGEKFYRMEEMDRKCVNDAAWDGYNGMSCFSSTIPAGVKEFAEAFGMRTSNVSYSFQGTTPLTTALFGVKYIFAEEEYSLGENYTEKPAVYQSGELILYENKNALPIGFVVDEGVEDGISLTEKRNPFAVQNSFARAVLNDSEAELYKPLVKQILNDRDDFNLTAGAETVQAYKKVGPRPVQVTIPGGQQAFLYVTSYVDEITVTTFVGEEVIGKKQSYDDLKFRRILDMGVSDEERILVIESNESKEVLSLHADVLVQETLEQVIAKLKEEPFIIEEITDRRMKGTVSGKGGILFTSIPYDKGWRVRVDGEEVETFAFKEAFISFPVSEGEHRIEMRYTPPGFYAGILGTLSGLILIGGMICLKRKRRKYLLEKT